MKNRDNLPVMTSPKKDEKNHNEFFHLQKNADQSLPELDKAEAEDEFIVIRSSN